MTIFGNLSRGLNRMSGGPRGQTLCARIAERWPECWFCRLMSRIVEPNHCAIELARWDRRVTPPAARPPYEWQRHLVTPYGPSWRTDRCTYVRVDLDRRTSSGTAVPELLGTSDQSLSFAKAIANVRPRENLRVQLENSRHCGHGVNPLATAAAGWMERESPETRVCQLRRTLPQLRSALIQNQFPYSNRQEPWIGLSSGGSLAYQFRIDREWPTVLTGSAAVATGGWTSREAVIERTRRTEDAGCSRFRPCRNPSRDCGRET